MVELEGNDTKLVEYSWGFEAETPEITVVDPGYRRSSNELGMCTVDVDPLAADTVVAW